MGRVGGVFPKFLAKKGKDIRGEERGIFACGEYVEFMRSYGTICGYSGCLLTRYSRKDARSFSESVLRHQEDCTSGVKQVTEQLQKGWFPNPKDDLTEFSLGILPKFYLSFWTQGTLSPLSLLEWNPPMDVSQTTSSLEFRLSDFSRN